MERDLQEEMDVAAAAAKAKAKKEGGKKQVAQELAFTPTRERGKKRSSEMQTRSAPPNVRKGRSGKKKLPRSKTDANGGNGAYVKDKALPPLRRLGGDGGDAKGRPGSAPRKKIKPLAQLPALRRPLSMPVLDKMSPADVYKARGRTLWGREEDMIMSCHASSCNALRGPIRSQ